MSETASTPPSTAGSSANLILPPITRTKCWASKWFTTIMKAIGWILFIGVMAVVLKTAVDRNREKLQEDTAIFCYECIHATGEAKVQLGLPVEEDCLLKPRNFRKCNNGEICAFVRTESGELKKVLRACASVKKTGCHSITKPAKSTFCYCNTSYCLK